MFDQFKAYLRTKITLTDEQFELISGNIRIKTFEKNQLILSPGGGFPTGTASLISLPISTWTPLSRLPR